MKKAFSFAVCVLTLSLGHSVSAFASSAVNGVNSDGDTLPIGAGGVTVETVTGSTKEADFTGPVTAASLGVAGAGSFGGNVNIGSLVALPDTNGALWGTAGTSANWFTVQNWDAVYGTSDSMTSKYYHLIGTYHGWDPNSIYIGGYNATNTLGSANATSVSFGGYGSGNPGWPTGSPAAFVDLVNHKVGVGTTSPQGTLDVENGAGNASICLNGQCASSLADIVRALFANMYKVSSAYTVDGNGTKTVFCNGNDIRTSCGYYSNPNDGMSLITSYAPEPVAPNGCSFTTPEAVDPWAVVAYCVH